MARHGENIRKRTDGRWEGRYKVFNEQQGKNVYHSVYGHSYEEVKARLLTNKFCSYQNSAEESAEHEKIFHNNNDTSQISNVLLFSQVAEEWLSEIKSTHKYSTYVKYSTLYKIHIVDIMGSFNILEMKKEKVSTEIFNHLSVNQQKGAYCIVNQILHYAEERYNIQSITLKRNVYETSKKTMKTFSKVEQEKLITCLYSAVIPTNETNTDNKIINIYKAAVTVCMYTGLRLGELCALQWSDIDFVDKTITVKRTVQRISVSEMAQKSILMETPPKNNTSNRIIPMSIEVITIFKNLCSSDPYVWGGKKPLEPRTLQYQFKKILKEAGIGDKNFHILRHTFATNCIENGMDTKSLSEILGHSNVKTTLNWYVHPTMEAKREQLGKLSRFYGQFYGQMI